MNVYKVIASIYLCDSLSHKKSMSIKNLYKTLLYKFNADSDHIKNKK